MRKPRTTVALGSAALVAALAITGCSFSAGTSTSDSPSTQESFSLGDNSVNTGGELPSYWPSDVPTPTGMTYEGGAQLSGNTSGSFSGTQSPEAVQQQLATDFKANGWTLAANYSGSGSNGGVTSWTKGSQTTQVVVATQDGKTVVNITVVNK